MTKRKESLVWQFFTKLGNGDAKCNACSKVFNRVHHNTSELSKHLERGNDDAHKELAKKYKESKKQREDEDRAKLESDQRLAASMFSVSQKRPKIELDVSLPMISTQPTLHQSFTEWNPNGDKAKKLDRLIVEMMALDIRPFTLIDNEGFDRVLKFLAHRYKKKSRSYYSTSMLSQLYAEIKNKVEFNWIPSYLCHSHVMHGLLKQINILYLALQFIIRMKNFSQAAKPIKGPHTAQNMSELLESVMSEYAMDRARVHLFLRDAATAMKATTRLLTVESEDCFAHKIQLDIEVRWGPTYAMISRLLEQREPLKLMMLSNSTLPKITATEWTILENLEFVLKPFSVVTKAIQSRSVTIAFVIPIYMGCKLTTANSKTATIEVNKQGVVFEHPVNYYENECAKFPASSAIVQAKLYGFRGGEGVVQVAQKHGEFSNFMAVLDDLDPNKTYRILYSRDTIKDCFKEKVNDLKKLERLASITTDSTGMAVQPWTQIPWFDILSESVVDTTVLLVDTHLETVFDCGHFVVHGEAADYEKMRNLASKNAYLSIVVLLGALFIVL